MSVDRRTFLRMAAASGLALAPAVSTRRAHAAAAPYSGPFYVTVHATGGWDTTRLLDPKGRVNELESDPVNLYFQDEITEIGPFKLAPQKGLAEFVTRFRDDLLVVHGVDTSTNNHAAGVRHVFTGSLNAGRPSFAALAAASTPNRPELSFISNSGFDEAIGLVPMTRMPNPATAAAVMHPYRLDPADPSSRLFTDATIERLRRARAERFARQHDEAHLPRVQKAMSILHEVRASDDSLKRLAEVLPRELDTSDNPLIAQAQLAVAAFRAGLAVSASLEIGNFDTHGKHLELHPPLLQKFLEGMVALMDEGEAQGIADQMVVVMGSDFSRTPWYNVDGGKDHWPITSMMMMGPGIRGGRVIGATDERQLAYNVDPDTLELDDNGVRMTPAHVHAALRELAGIEHQDVVARYPVGASLPLFR